MPRPRPTTRVAALVLTLTLSGALFLSSTASAAPVRRAAAPERTKVVRINEKKLTQQLRAYAATRPGSVSVSFRDLTTGQWYTYRHGTKFRTASIVKVDILATLLLRHQRAGTKLTKSERALATRMIHTSDNAAASELWNRVGGAAGVAKANRRFGLKATTPSTYFWGQTTTTAADQVRLLRTLTGDRSVLKKRARNYLWGLMRGVTPSQRWGVPKAADAKSVAAVKDGWAPRHEDGGRWTINTTGRIRIGGHLVVVAVLTRGNPDMNAGVATVDRIAAKIRTAVRHAH